MNTLVCCFAHLSGCSASFTGFRVHLSEDCNDLDSTLCALPFPSSTFLVQDDTSGTGYRVKFHTTSLPETLFGEYIQPRVWDSVLVTADRLKWWNEMDGFSTICPVLFYLPEATLNGLYSHLELPGVTIHSRCCYAQKS